jgi:predicted amidohydrolase YtcJ
MSGSDAEILAEIGAGKKVNLSGKTMLPGLTDSHMHFEMYAYGLKRIDCETSTLQECMDRVSSKAKQTLDGEWIFGFGWNQNVWEEGYGSAAILDAVSGGHPAYLVAKSGHAAWVNSIALQMAGISSATPDPEGGVIQRDSSGKPTGILFENANLLVEKILPDPDPEETARMISDAQPVLWSQGLTGLHDYDGSRCFSALQLLDKENKLRLRVNKGIPLSELPHAVSLGLRSGFGSHFLHMGSIKCFSDGALGPQTAAMLQLYEGSETDRGMLLMDSEQLFDIGQTAVRNGLSVTVHAIGDRANHEILNGFEQLREFEKRNGLKHPRHRIEHVQILHGDDLARLAKLDIIASMQPIHATSDMHIATAHWGDRSANAYALKSLLDLGTLMAFGSDAPVELPNPFYGIHAAVTRRRMDGTPGDHGWYPEQRLTLQQALDGYTIGAAYAAGWENDLGKLAPGYFADLIILAKDPFKIQPQELFTLKPETTMVAGEIVWQA